MVGSATDCGVTMAEKLEEAPVTREAYEVRSERPRRAKLTAEESLRRLQAFPERKEQIIAAVGKRRGEARFRTATDAST
jgi:hypothetical protein